MKRSLFAALLGAVLATVLLWRWLERLDRKVQEALAHYMEDYMEPQGAEASPYRGRELFQAEPLGDALEIPALASSN